MRISDRSSDVCSSDLDLREHLRASLPEYMLPQHYVPIERITLLPNGKIYRSALPVPASEFADDAPNLLESRREVSADTRIALLQKIWADVLEIGRAS